MFARDHFHFWFLTWLRTLFSWLQQLVRLARTTSLTPPLLEINATINVEKPSGYHELYLVTYTSPSKPLTHPPQVLDETLALINGPLLATALREDRSREPISSPICVLGEAKVRTDGTSTLRHEQTVLAWLIHSGFHFAPPSVNKGTVIPTAIARRPLPVRASRWFRIVRILTSPYQDTVLWNSNLEYYKSSIINSMAFDDTSNTLSPEPSTQSQPPTPISQVSDPNAFYGNYFIPADPLLLGCVEEPKGSPLCAGGYSDVWRCKVRFSTPSEALPVEVAVKVLRSVWLSGRNEVDANERKLRRFNQEVITWLELPKHPNIVPLIGWTLTPNLSFISPWYQQGNLYRHLKKLSDTQQIQVLLGIARGLECLHSRKPPVVHGDLKPENILISDQGESLLADFGLSTILGEERMYTSSHRVGGSVPWMSPEQMIEGSRSCQSDVYSFGSLAFTVMTGELPHAGLTNGQITLKVCNSIDPKDPVEDWSKYPRLQGPVKELLNDCWSRSPNARPFISDIVRRLTALLDPREPK